ncbi:DNA polymerase III subunit epsilon [Aquisalinus flavus]|uniref:DNA polymerase III subunit epsilon n=1 Tax=Aquisalinus flavus TaxID=1526572 RepID=A0A8J2V674_9PROT|nr:DNA polymerase III subunit epsilon [Aquisalinus flavus]MBD0425602.1 DNA polymerase III subunit epsilon [Aquisalinus flavus]UNE48779.1 DNA polymerase III subunit epsilon [Aquisalinus flavus]GGD14743.1 DNA polymerase III subunit epsilon [Aquisalinus flavus]
MRQIIFDTETTGFDPGEHRVVEIGAIELVRGAITGNSFHVYINPERDMPPDAERVHGLSAAFLRDKPVFGHDSVGKAFCAFIADAELIAHNADFDMRFIQYELKKCGLPALANSVIDTLKLARRKFPGAPASLDALCSRFGIDTAERERHGHGALLDSRLLAEVYIELTGGAQAGLDFTTLRDGEEDGSIGGKALQRPVPLDRSLSDGEKAAHAAFIAEMESPLWAKLLKAG